MESHLDLDIRAISRATENDAHYQQLLFYYQETEGQYDRLKARLSPDEERIIEDYLAASEAIHYRFAQLAYHCGTVAINKTAAISR